MEHNKPIIFVCTTSYYPFLGGAEVAIQEVARRLTSSFRFIIVTARLRRDLPKKEIRSEGTIIRLGLGHHFDKWLLPFLSFWYFFWKLAMRNWRLTKFPILLWGVDISQGSLGAALAALFFPRIPFVLTLQYGGGEERVKKGRGGFLKYAFRFMLARADETTAISSYLAALAKTYGYQKKVRLIHNGVDVQRFANGKWQIANGKRKIIITTSRLVYKNGIDTLIDAMVYVRKKFPDAQCWIVGDGPERTNYELRIKHYELEKNIKLFGSVPYGEIPHYLAQADFFVRPSRSEGMGNSFVEALAAGLPIIGTPTEGILDIIEDGKTGLFAEQNNPKDVSEKIIYMFEHSDHARKMAEEGRKKVEERFSWDGISDQYRVLFKKELRQRVLIATGLFPPAVGGPATYSKLLLEELPKHGIPCDIADFGRVRSLPKIIRHCAYFFLVLKKARKADIVFAQDPVSVGIPAALAAKLLRKPFILKIVGDYAWEQGVQRYGIKDLLDEFLQKKYGWRVEFLRRLERWCARRVRVVIVPSAYLKNVVRQWGIPEDRIRVIYNAFDAPHSALTKEQARAQLNLSGTVLVSAGRFVPWKGFDILIEVIARVRKKIPDAWCSIIGDGPERKNLESKIKNQRLEDSVKILGAKAHDRALLYFQAGDLFVLNTGYEGFSHTILEAMAMGIPVITTQAGGNPELIEHGKTGFFAEYNNRESFVGAITAFFSLSEKEKQEIRERAQKKAQEFTKERMIRETLSTLTNSQQPTASSQSHSL